MRFDVYQYWQRCIYVFITYRRRTAGAFKYVRRYREQQATSHATALISKIRDPPRALEASPLTVAEPWTADSTSRPGWVHQQHDRDVCYLGLTLGWKHATDLQRSGHGAVWCTAQHSGQARNSHWQPCSPRTRASKRHRDAQRGCQACCGHAEQQQHAITATRCGSPL